jgi:hypothetical protein
MCNSNGYDNASPGQAVQYIYTPMDDMHVTCENEEDCHCKPQQPASVGRKHVTAVPLFKADQLQPPFVPTLVLFLLPQ